MIYNPLDKFYKSITGGVPEKTEITFRVKGNFDSVVFVLRKDGLDENLFSMQKKSGYFELKLEFEVGLYFYHFRIDSGKSIGLGADYCGIIVDNPSDFQLTVYQKNYTVPKWLHGGVIYQIFPDRFCRVEKIKDVPAYKVLHDNWSNTPIYLPNEKGKILNNDFFGGDIKGIIGKLDYLCELGITAIYLNPIFKAYSNHRYDTGDYMQIDPMLGSLEDFKSLISAADSKGIKIILDGVFNHTGDDSIYFNKYGRYEGLGAYQSKKSPYYDWYNFTDYPNKYESWWGIETLPAINESNSKYLDFITGKGGVLDFYTKLGVGGWRLDVVDELPAEFVKKIRSAVKEVDSNAVIIGEVWEDASNKISYGKRREYLQGQELDSAMNYPLKEAIISFIKYGSGKHLSYVIKEQIDHYPQNALNSMMNILSTHDTARLLTVLGGKDCNGMSKTEMANTFIPKEELARAKYKFKAATLLQFTLCGVPSIYYGDEVGMQGYADPLNRRTFPWGSEDQEILSWYKFLCKLRKEYSAFTYGEYEELYSSDTAIVFKRFDRDSEVLVCMNNSDKELTLNFLGELYELYTGKEIQNEYVLDSKSFAVFVKNAEID